jgi:hypothetical protein
VTKGLLNLLMVGEVGLEPTKAKPADLQSAPFAARDTPPFHRPEAADEKAPANRGQVEGALSCAAPSPVNPKSVRAAFGPRAGSGPVARHSGPCEQTGAQAATQEKRF